MSYRRKKYDGDLTGGSAFITERGNSNGNEGQTDQYAPTKRSIKNAEIGQLNDQVFVEEHDKDRYLITYADLITLLLGLFIILYAISNVDNTKYQKMISAMGDVFGKENSEKMIKTGEFSIKNEIFKDRNLKNSLQELIKQNDLAQSMNLEENERGITIHIMDKLLFPPADATLNDGSKIVLKKIASLIKDIKNDIRIEGHTDNIPISSAVFPSNWHLSVTRALNTAYYLINQEGLSPDKVSIVGYSEYRPVDSNNDPKGRARNRRVDIVILNK